jgi:hypothetical protein
MCLRVDLNICTVKFVFARREVLQFSGYYLHHSHILKSRAPLVFKFLREKGESRVFF